MAQESRLRGGRKVVKLSLMWRWIDWCDTIEGPCGERERGALRADKETRTMGKTFRRAGVILAGMAAVCTSFVAMRLRAENRAHMRAQTTQTNKTADSDAAAKLNSVGVAYMGQQRFADAQKEFEAALAADGNYALAKLNLG